MHSSYQSVESPGIGSIVDETGRASSASSRAIQWRLYIAALMLLDSVLIFMAFTGAAWVRLSLPLPFFNLGAMPTVPSISLVALGIVPTWVVVFATQGLYHRRNLLGGMQEYAAMFRGTAVGMLIVVILGFLRPIPMPARGWVVVAWVMAAVLLIAGRFVLRRVVYFLRGKGMFLTPALIIGANAEARSLAEQLLNWHRSGLAVAGFVSRQTAPGEMVYRGLPVLGEPDDLELIVERFGIEELIVTNSALDQDEILSLFKRFGMRSDVSVRLSSGLFEVITTGLEVKEVASVPLVRIRQARLSEHDQVIKLALDLLLSLGLLLLFSPLLLFIPIAIRLDSPGPIIYRRRVIGLNGRPYEAFKFRTMFVEGDAMLADRADLQGELAETHKLKDDPRVTRVGRVLRRHSLDELPQLLNVLRREMSVVGPRMISPDEIQMYEHWDMNLLTVLPGITGLWQVSGRSDVSVAERVQLDMRYIRNWSIWLDFHILMRTVIVVIKGQGAY